MKGTNPTLIAADTLKALPAMTAEKGPGWVDLVVTSPPYNLGIKYGEKSNDHKTEEEYIRFTRDWANMVKEALSENGSFFLNAGSAPASPGRPFQIVTTLLEEGWVLQNTFHWIKSISVTKKDGTIESHGHFKPINSERFVNDCHEYVSHFTKTGNVPLNRKAAGVPYQDKSNLLRWGHTKGVDRRCRGNVWHIPYKTIKSRAGQRPHPASFPPALPRMCILLHGHPKKTRMLDPFLGIGNSLAAATANGIKEFTGIEIEEEFLDYAIQTHGNEIPSNPGDSPENTTKPDPSEPVAKTTATKTTKPKKKMSEFELYDNEKSEKAEEEGIALIEDLIKKARKENLLGKVRGHFIAYIESRLVDGINSDEKIIEDFATKAEK